MNVGEVAAPPREQAFILFLTGFLVLFLELASIRWFAANVIFLQFFTNVVLLASFLGMSCGCLAARSPRDWLGHFPLIALYTVLAALGLLALYNGWQNLNVDVGHQTSPQEVFFGTEYRVSDIAKFTIPIDVIVGAFFLMIALMFVGLGQVLGRAFDAYPNRVLGYTFNIGGSLAGIAAFSLISLLQAPPLVWFAIACSGVAYLLQRDHGLTWLRGSALLVLVALVALASLRSGAVSFWSPYYEVNLEKSDLTIDVNNIAHQQIVPFAKSGASYSLIHLLQRDTGGSPFRNVLIVGAGSGNDVDHALRFGARHIDAVEIDPVIQHIGVAWNPDRPYADARVVAHIDDGRHFLRTTTHKYDLVEYALVDSLILHSSYANLRLESYLFTKEAFADVKRSLAPDGSFVMYNYFRQGWVVERVAAMAEEVFGCKPIVVSLPYRAELPSSSSAGFTMIIAGCNRTIGSAFAAHGSFWLNQSPPQNLHANGFGVTPQSVSNGERGEWQRIAPTRMLHEAGAPLSATDDWPFLYLRGRLIPDLNVRSMLLLGSLGIGLVFFFLPRGREIWRIDWRMFFLGAAFMLIETKAVVQLALLFGSTWIVNSLVFFAALVLVLAANLFALKTRAGSLIPHYAALFVLIVVSLALPLEVFLSGSVFWRYAVPGALVLAPMFFAGVIFARTFAQSSDPDVSFGSNIAGSVVGGLCESFSMVLGFKNLLLLALAFYLLSALNYRTRRATNAA